MWNYKEHFYNTTYVRRLKETDCLFTYLLGHARGSTAEFIGLVVQNRVLDVKASHLGHVPPGESKNTFTCLFVLPFRHRASSIKDRRFATLQRTLFIYLINKYISLSDICLTVHH